MIVFMQGEDYDEFEKEIESRESQFPETPYAELVVDYLSQWDYGEETEMAAEVNGDMYDHIFPAARAREYEHNGYTAVVSSAFGWVELYREL